MVYMCVVSYHILIFEFLNPERLERKFKQCFIDGVSSRVKFWNLERLERKFESWFIYVVSILMFEFWNVEQLGRKFE